MQKLYPQEVSFIYFPPGSIWQINPAYAYAYAYAYGYRDQNTSGYSNW